VLYNLLTKLARISKTVGNGQEKGIASKLVFFYRKSALVLDFKNRTSYYLVKVKGAKGT